MKPHWPVPAGLHMAAARLPAEGELPSFGGATGWLNSPPLTPAGLRGSVVLASFWTYTCINWLRQLPYLRAWAAKYAEHGLVVIGVHTPEFPFEHDPDNVRRAVKDLRVGYPVATDNDYAIWEAFGNHYWPALYFADSQGQIRHHYFGEGEYQQSEMVIQQLLADAGFGGIGHDLVSVNAQGIEAAADWAALRSPENYTGYARTENFASPGGLVPGRPHGYTAPARLRLNQWAVSGDWTAEEQAITLNTAGGQIACRFLARDLNMVMGPAVSGTPARFRMLLDGQPPGEAHGIDVDGQGGGTVGEQRLYQLIRQPGPVTERTFEIAFPDPGPGVQAFVFTFG
jgi:thiol-disulfide isomerase/thioredoxin